MTQQAPLPSPAEADAGTRVARLRQVHGLVRELAGRAATAPVEAAMDEAARISAAYESALPVDRKRFDALAAETARWSAAGLEALVRLDERGLPVRTAAERLAEELERALAALERRLPR